MEGDHAIKQQVILPLGDDLCLAVLRDKHRKLFQMSADEVPYTFLHAGFQLEATFKATVGFVGGDDEILLDGADSDGLIERALLFVENPYVCHDEPRNLQRFLDGRPDTVARIMKNHGHPASRLENAAILCETAAHEMLVLGKPFLLVGAYNGFRLHIGEAFMEGFHNEVQFCIGQIVTKGRVGEDIVDGIVGKPQPRGCTRR